MFKMQGLIGNKGSTTVEMCFIMPIVLFVIFFLIELFIGAMEDGLIQSQLREYVLDTADKADLNSSEDSYDSKTVTGLYSNEKASLTKETQYFEGNIKYEDSVSALNFFIPNTDSLEKDITIRVGSYNVSDLLRKVHYIGDKIDK